MYPKGWINFGSGIVLGFVGQNWVCFCVTYILNV